MPAFGHPAQAQAGALVAWLTTDGVLRHTAPAKRLNTMSTRTAGYDAVQQKMLAARFKTGPKVGPSDR